MEIIWKFILYYIRFINMFWVDNQFPYRNVNFHFISIALELSINCLQERCSSFSRCWWPPRWQQLCRWHNAHIVLSDRPNNGAPNCFWDDSHVGWCSTSTNTSKRWHSVKWYYRKHWQMTELWRYSSYCCMQKHVSLVNGTRQAHSDWCNELDMR